MPVIGIDFFIALLFFKVVSMLKMARINKNGVKMRIVNLLYQGSGLREGNAEES